MKCLRRLAALALALLLTLPLTVPASAESGFADVPSTHWAANAIRRSAEVGIIRGETATRFGLGHSMTRGAFVTVLCRFFGWELVDDTGSFTDVEDDLWCRRAIETALVHGAVTLQTDEFRPNDPITREELAVMLVRALGYGSISGLDLGLSCPFADVDTSVGYLTLAYCLGIVKGTTEETFQPDAAASREQAVVMMMRLYDRCFSAAPAKLGYVSDVASNANWGDFTDLILPGGRLSASGLTYSPGQSEDFLVQCRLAGSRAILGVTVDAGALSGDSTLQASRIVSLADGYAGLAITVSGMTAKHRDALSALLAALRAAAPEQRLLLRVNASGSYDLESLAALCDGLLLETTPAAVTKNGVKIAPLEPPEEIIRAVAPLSQSTREKLILFLTADADGLTEDAVTVLAGKSRVYGSDRYAQGYLITDSGAVWYHDVTSISRRVQLCRLFGIGSVCLSDLSALSADSGILKGITG